MANIAAGYTFGSTETVTSAKLAAMVNDATISNIVDADIDGSANIDGSKINTASLSYLTAGMASTNITGLWKFDNMDAGNFIGSFASIGNINTSGIIASIGSISSIRFDSAVGSIASISTISFKDMVGSINANQSLVSISTLNVSTINGISYSESKNIVCGRFDLTNSNHYGTFGTSSATENLTKFTVPVSGTIKNFYVYSSQGSGDTGTIRVNGVNTSVSISSPNYSDTTHTASVSAGDTISIFWIYTGETRSIGWSFQIT